MTFTRSRSPIMTNYRLLGSQLERVEETRDLGLTLDKNLDFRTHMTNICKSASKILGFVMRVASQFRGGCVAIAKVLYNAYVRSKLEYGAVVWDPYESNYALMIEKIQRKFCRWLYKRTYGYYPYLYPSIFVLGMVSYDTLELRRKMLLVVHYYGVLRSKVDNPSILERVQLTVPQVDKQFGDMRLAQRRQPPLFVRPSVRTRRAENAPTARALALLGQLLTQHKEADIFHDKLVTFTRFAHIFISNNYCKL